MADHLGDAFVNINGSAEGLKRTLNDLDKTGAKAGENAGRAFKKGFEAAPDPDADVNTKKAQTKWEKLKKHIKGDDLGVDIDANTTKLKASLAKVKESVKNISGNVDLDVKDHIVNIKAKIDPKNKHHINDEFDDMAKKREVAFEPETNAGAKAATQAILAAVGRPRTVEYYPKVNSKALASAKTLLNAFSGMRMLQDQTQMFWNMLKNLDKSIPKLTIMSTVFAGIGNLLTSAISNTSSLLVNVGQIAGAALALPSIFTGATIGIGTMLVGLKDISSQVPQINTQLGILQKGISGEFWSQATSGVSKFVDTAFKDFSSGLITTSKYTGEFTGHLAESLSKALDTKSLDTMFNNLNTSIRITTGTTDDLANIFRILGETGSQYLPRMSTWIADLTTKFSGWLSDIEASGRLNEIIDTGIQRLTGLGNVLLNSGKIIGHIGKIAEESGAASINSMADSLERVNTIVHGEAFSNGLTNVFTGAHKAMSTMSREIGSTFTDLAKTMSRTIPDMMSSLAPAIGKALNGIFKGLDSKGFQSGFRDMFNGIAKGLSGLSGNIPGLMSNLGSLLSVIGNLAEHLLPLLGTWLEKVSSIFSSVAPLINAIIPPLTAVTTAFANMLSPGLLAGLALLGPGFSAAATGALGFVGSTSRFGKIATGIAEVATGSTRMGTAIRGASMLASGALGLILKPLGLISKGFSALAATKFPGLAAGAAGAAASLGKVGTAASGASSAVGAVGGAAAGTAAKTGLFNAALSAVGSTVGGLALGVGAAAVGIGAAAVGIGVYSNHVQKAKVDTQLASTELSNFTKTANDLKGTQLDKLLSTGWGPARDEITSATEAFSKFGDTAKSAMDSGFGKNTNNFKNYMNDVKQLDEIMSGMVQAGDIDAAKEMYTGFRQAVSDAGGDVKQFESDTRATTAAFREQGIEIKTTTDSYDRIRKGVTEAAKAQSDAANDQAEAVRLQTSGIADYAAQYQTLNSKIFDARGAVRKMSDAHEDLQEKLTGTSAEYSNIFAEDMPRITSSFSKHADQLSELTDLTLFGTKAQRDFGSSLEEVVTTDLAAFSNMKTLGKSNEEIATKMGESREAIIKMGEAAGITRPIMEEFLDQAGIYGYDAAMKQLDGTMSKVVQNIDGVSVAAEKLTNGKWSISVNGEQIDATTQKMSDLTEVVTGGAHGSVLINGNEVPGFMGNTMTAEQYFNWLEIDKNIRDDILISLDNGSITPEQISKMFADGKLDDAEIKVITDAAQTKENVGKAINGGGPYQVEVDTKLSGDGLGKKTGKGLFGEGKFLINTEYNSPKNSEILTPKTDVEVPSTLEKPKTTNWKPSTFGLDPVNVPTNVDRDSWFSDLSKLINQSQNKKVELPAETKKASAWDKGINEIKSSIMQSGNGGTGTLAMGVGTKKTANALAAVDSIASSVEGMTSFLPTATKKSSSWFDAVSSILTDTNSQTGYVGASSVKRSNWFSAAAETLNFTNTRTGYVGADSTKRGGWATAALNVKQFTDTRTGYVGASSRTLGNAYSAPASIASRIGSYAGFVRVGSTPAGNYLAGAYAVRAAVNAMSAAIRVVTSSANGNIFLGAQHFAKGGFAKTENHIAQIASAGTRIWAEPETLGEAYIPLALSKRVRSRQILQKTAELLNMTTPQPKEYKDGGIASTRSNTDIASTPIQITMNVVNGDKMDEDQLGRAISRELANRMRV